MNLILEDCQQVPYFTNMRWVLDALGLNASEFDWFVSDIEHMGGDAFRTEDHWISGAELERVLRHNDIQFVWAVFSAIPKDGSRPPVHAPRTQMAMHLFGPIRLYVPNSVARPLKSCAGIAAPSSW